MFENDRLVGDVFLVDDDEIVRESLSVEFIRAGYRVTAFSEGTSFVSAARERIPVCAVVDMFTPGLSGMDILKRLDAKNYPAPICIVSGRADISLVVEAIKSGASDFFEKQAGVASLIERVRKMIEVWSRHRQTDSTSNFRWQPFPGREHLSGREIEVLDQIAMGATSKAAAEALGISPRTIETHRSHILKKLGAKNAVELVRMVLRGGRDPKPPRVNARTAQPSFQTADHHPE